MRLLAPVLAVVAMAAGITGTCDALAGSANPIDTTTYLIQFHKDPKSVMNSPLAKRDETGAIVEEEALPFKDMTPEQINEAKQAVRVQICKASGAKDCDKPVQPGQFAGFNERNQIKQFLFSENFIQKPLEMEQRGLLKASSPYQPWSDSFWPMTKGIIGRRWQDSSFPNSNDWTLNYGYVTTVPAWIISPDIMAPSEKYDFLVGDTSFRLTDKMWAPGRDYVMKGRKVPNWAGICDGWAPAAIMSPNPKKSVTVMSTSGTPVTFTPSDIKALAALAWAKTRPQIKQAGKRCDLKNPQEDAVGRVIDYNCFDVNPGTWHMAIVNQLGVDRRGFVFDSTFDQQIWNYPIYAYQYHYFNPQTLATSNQLAGALIKINDFTIDKFKSYRSPDAKYVVGIAMDLHYSNPTQPSVRPVKTASIKTVKYVYDLELDAEGKIIGGEWYSNWHPDFIWNLPTDKKPMANVERGREAPLVWDGSGPVSPEVQSAAWAASAEGEGQPLGVIVDTLLKLAQ